MKGSSMHIDDHMSIMVKTYECDKEQFQVEWARDIPYLTVTYKDQVGYVGVNPNGSTLFPFWWVVNDADARTTQGLSRGNVPLHDGSLESCLSVQGPHIPPASV